MIAITNERELQDFFTRENAVLFFHAQWSDYAVKLPAGVTARPNPVSGKEFKDAGDLELK